ALSLPTEEAARIALRTQQVIAYESGAVETVDPLAGSYFVESLTDEVERLAWEYIRKIDAMGGAVDAIEAGYIQNEIANASYEYQQSIEKNERIIVGVNQFSLEEPPFDKHFSIDDSIREIQMKKIRQLKSERDASKVKKCIVAVESAARNGTNLMPVIIDAAENLATLGEIADAMRRVFGEYE
ncbi:MAG TPA: methylmalonyl-CoA mutase family protein, partial [Bacteroidia bacterium]|nr:methylmalonyl-CoA mutase family protein [Bacteroidia bacterium]